MNELKKSFGNLKKATGQWSLLSSLFLSLSLPLPSSAQEHDRPHDHNMNELHGDPQAYIAMLEDPKRDSIQKPDEVIKALNLKEGDVVADIGAGSGYFTFRIARQLGKKGRIYAVDVSPDMVLHMNRKMRDLGVKNVVTVLAPGDDPLLSDSTTDLVFICNTWHHIEKPRQYLDILKRVLRPGGRIVMIDFQKRELPVGPPVSMKIAREDLIAQMTNSGFNLVKERSFLPYQYFLEFSPQQ